MPGFRDKPWVKKAENCMLSFLGAWGALTFIGELIDILMKTLEPDLVTALAARAHEFQARHVPTIIGSFGAGERNNRKGRWCFTDPFLLASLQRRYYSTPDM